MAEKIRAVMPFNAKRPADTLAADIRPQKKAKALLEEDDISMEDDSSASNAGGISLREKDYKANGTGFRVNEEFARRFEHNKKREELHRRMS